MDHFDLERLNAGARKAAAIPVAGLVVGLMAGLAWASVLGADEFGRLWFVVKAGLAGSFLGMAAAFAAATGGRSQLASVRGLAWLVVIAAVLAFFWTAIP